MDFADLIRARRSVRSYRPDPVEPDKLERVLEAARLAPSACNRQPFRMMVVSTAGREAELATVYSRPWFVQAPLIIAACGVASEAWTRGDGKIYVDVDVTIAMDHLILAAADEGLGTCWIAAFDPVAARLALKPDPGWEPLLLTPLGYPADVPRPRQRRPLAELVKRV